MPDFDFLDKMNRKEKRAAANSLRGVQKCLNCDLFGKCYNEQQKVISIRDAHKGNGMLPKGARQLPTETCEYHESNNEKGEFYPKYDSGVNKV